MSSAFPGFQDPLNFVKKMWGDMQIPGMVTPSLSQEEIEKQIHDLKAVESWLQMHMNVLRTTIQGLEVQKATLHALKTMGEQFSQMKPSEFSTSKTTDAFDARNDARNDATATSEDASKKAESAATIFPDTAQWWMGLQEQFQHALSQVAQQTATQKTTSETEKKTKTPASKTTTAKTTTAKTAKVTKPRAARTNSKATNTRTKRPSKPTN